MPEKEKGRTCPLMSAQGYHFNNIGGQIDGAVVVCKEHDCRLFTGVYTVENKKIYDCAFVVLAMKDATGFVHQP